MNGTGRTAAVPSSAGESVMSAQALQDELTDAGGIGLAPGRLHDLADQDSGCGYLTVTDLGDHVGVCGDGIVHGGGKRALVADHGQATGFDHLVRVALA